MYIRFKIKIWKSGNIFSYIFSVTLSVIEFSLLLLKMLVMLNNNRTIKHGYSELTRYSHLWRSTNFSDGEKNTVLGGIRKRVVSYYILTENWPEQLCSK